MLNNVSFGLYMQKTYVSSRKHLLCLYIFRFFQVFAGFHLTMAERRRISSDSSDAVPPGALSTNTTESSVEDSRADGKKLGKMTSSSSKYRHVEAVHSTLKSSCLSHDYKEKARDHHRVGAGANRTQCGDEYPVDTSITSPSFLGFRNLIVLVVGKLYPGIRLTFT